MQKLQQGIIQDNYYRDSSEKKLKNNYINNKFINGEFSKLGISQQIELLLHFERANSSCILDRQIESNLPKDVLTEEIERVQKTIVRIVSEQAQKEEVPKAFGGASDDCSAATWVLEHMDEISDKQALLKLAIAAKWEQTAYLLR